MQVAQVRAIPICDLAREPMKYQFAQISVVGTIISDGVHGATIISERTCGVDIGIDSRNPNVVKLWHAIYDGHPGTVDKSISAKVSGTFTYKKSSPRDLLLLAVENATDVVVTRKN